MGAGRHALLAGDRAADRQPDRVADGRPGAGDAAGHQALSARADRARPQGRVPQGAGRAAEARLSAGQDRRQDDASSTRSAPLNKNLKHDIEIVVDRIIVDGDLGNRLADSFETALELADGIAITEDADPGEQTIFSAKFACPVSGFTIPEIEPRLFSFNNPFGACPACDGLGTKLYFDPDLVVHDARRSLAEGAVSPWSHSIVAILHADPGEHRPALPPEHAHAVARPAGKDAADDPLRLGRRADQDDL